MIEKNGYLPNSSSIKKITPAKFCTDIKRREVGIPNAVKENENLSKTRCRIGEKRKKVYESAVKEKAQIPAGKKRKLL